MKVSVFIAATLDGFIAREDGALDWLPGSDGTVQEGLEDEDFGYQYFMVSVSFTSTEAISLYRLITMATARAVSAAAIATMNTEK